MKLDLDFNALTRLKDWWEQVKNNFKTIETECTKTRELADKACTKEQAQAYVAEFAGSTADYIEAIEKFSELYKSSGEAMTALDSIYGKRMRYDKLTGADMDRISIVEDGVYVCVSGTLNAPAETGTLIVLDGGRLWLSADGTELYYRTSGGEWRKTDAAITERLDTAEAALSGKSETVFGTYTGDGNESQFIKLGFTPAAVEIYGADGAQKHMTGNYAYSLAGGLAMTGKACELAGYDDISPVFEISENGFTVYKWTYTPTGGSTFTCSANSAGTHYFKAYKYGTVTEV